MDHFEGKTVVITGAGSGIGRATALRFAQGKAKLVLNDLPSQKGLLTVVQEVRDTGAECVMRLGDVSKPEDVKAIFQGLERVDVLVNVAGYLKEVPFMEMTDEDWDDMIRVHLYGTFYTCRAAVPLMVQEKNGRIINISSDLGQIGCEKLAHYSAAKGGIIAFSKSLARELAAQGILVNSVAPGGTITPLVERLGESYIEEESSKYPLQRLGQPEEIAAAVVFLASKDASFMTGQVLGVNGGGVMNG